MSENLQFQELQPGISGIRITEELVMALWNSTTVPPEIYKYAKHNRRLYARPHNHNMGLTLKDTEGNTISSGNINDWLIINLDGKLSIVEDDLLRAFCSFDRSIAKPNRFKGAKDLIEDSLRVVSSTVSQQ